MCLAIPARVVTLHDDDTAVEDPITEEALSSDASDAVWSGSRVVSRESKSMCTSDTRFPDRTSQMCSPKARAAAIPEPSAVLLDSGKVTR